jgi:hypothetical protein
MRSDMACSKLEAYGLNALAARWFSPIQFEVEGDIEGGGGSEDFSRVFDQAHKLEKFSRALAHGRK